jgi:drug/metabolite transporter (DMT)-like permease
VAHLLSARHHGHQRIVAGHCPGGLGSRRYRPHDCAGLEGNLAAGRFAGCPGWSAVVYLFAESVHLLGAGRAAVFPSLVPPFVLLVGWLALGEAPTALQLAGVILVLFGFRLAQSTPRRYQA